MISITLKVCLLLVSTAHAMTSPPPKTPYSIFESFLRILGTAARYQSEWAPDIDRPDRQYDFIVVGGGTAGCVVAGRLSENPNHSVLLLEAGSDEFFIYDIPILANYFQLTEPNWGHRTLAQDSACLSFDKRRCKMPRGKVLGGSSVLNYMIYTRGNRKDYDAWSNLGNNGWSYQEVLPYFRKLENVNIEEFKNSSQRGYTGPVILNHAPYHTQLADSFLDAGVELGYDVHDLNGQNQVGFNYLELTMNNGTRFSANRAYIMSVRNRKNLHVSKYSMVTKLLINPITNQCYGVEYVKNDVKHQVFSNREVILSAGVFGSPQILMLSGIGPREHLESLKIPVIQDLRVGYNLQDHIALGAFTFVINQNLSIITTRIIDDAKSLVDYFAFHTGPLSIPGGVEAIAFLNSQFNSELDYPDIEILFGAGSVGTDPTLRRNIGLTDQVYNALFSSIENMDAFTLFPMLLRPKSRGRVMLKSRNPYILPLIQHNYLTHEDDIEIIVEGIKIALQIANTKAFQRHGTRVHDALIPACREYAFGTDDYWRCAVRQLTLNIYHQCGTAKMGPTSDSDAVVDSELRVYGVGGLRVIDASIIPLIPTGHTNGPTLMIAEKGADMIKNYWMNVNIRRY